MEVDTTSTLEPVYFPPSTSTFQRQYERSYGCSRCGKPVTHSVEQFRAERPYWDNDWEMASSRRSGEQQHECSACLVSQPYSISASHGVSSWEESSVPLPPLPIVQNSAPLNPVEAQAMNNLGQSSNIVYSRGCDDSQSIAAQNNHSKAFDPGTKTSTSLYFSDSGYASAPPVVWRENHQNAPATGIVVNQCSEVAEQEQQANDINEKNLEMGDLRTIYSDASAAMSTKERYISELVEDLVENISTGRALNDVPLDKLRSTLPSLLKAFATTLGHIGGSQPSRDIMVFVSKHRE